MVSITIIQILLFMLYIISLVKKYYILSNFPFLLIRLKPIKASYSSFLYQSLAIARVSTTTTTTIDEKDTKLINNTMLIISR
jgi:hypothetical protein